MTDTSYLYKYFLEKSPGQKETGSKSNSEHNPKTENIRETSKEENKDE